MQDRTELTQRIITVHQEAVRPGSTDLPTYLAASDIHGNHHRLREILRTAKQEGVARVYLVGDIYSGAGGWGLYRMLRPLVDSGRSFSELTASLRKLPQLMVNVETQGEAGLVARCNQVQRAVCDQAEVLKDRGRVLVRPSGTEPVVRVMVEGEDESEVRAIAGQLADIVSAVRA